MSDRDVGYFDRWSSTYDRSPAQRLFFDRVHEALWRVLSADTGSPRCIVDAGCGTGRLLALLHRRLPHVDLVGVDPAEGMIREARRRFDDEPHVRFEVASARALPLDDRSVDVVTSSVSFHHWDDQAASLVEIHRVLRPHGRLLIADFFAAGLVGTVLARFSRGHGRGWRSPEEMTGLLYGAGLIPAARHRVFGPAPVVSVVEARAPQR